MSAAEATDDGFRVLSALPGRERWDIGILRGRPRLVSRLEQILNGRTEVVSVSGSAVTGRLLIVYDPNIASEELALHVRTALDSSLDAIDFEPAPRKREVSEIEFDAELNTIGAVVGTVLAGAGPLAAIALGITATVAVATTADGLERQREVLDTPHADPKRPDPLPRFLQYAQPYRRQIILASTFSVLKKIFDIAPPLLIGLGIAIGSPGGSSLLAAVGITTIGPQLAVLGVLTVAIFTGESIFEYLQKVMWRRLAQSLQRDLRLDAYARV